MTFYRGCGWYYQWTETDKKGLVIVHERGPWFTQSQAEEKEHGRNKMAQNEENTVQHQAEEDRRLPASTA